MNRKRINNIILAHGKVEERVASQEQKVSDNAQPQSNQQQRKIDLDQIDLPQRQETSKEEEDSIKTSYRASQDLENNSENDKNDESEEKGEDSSNKPKANAQNLKNPFIRAKEEHSIPLNN